MRKTTETKNVKNSSKSSESKGCCGKTSNGAKNCGKNTKNCK